MFAPLRSSFGAKLILLITLTSTAAVVLVCAVLVTISYFRFRQMAVHDLASQAQMIALHSTAALTFNDPDAATQTLAGLKAVPEMASASLHAADGRTFAEYRRATGQPPVLPAHESGYFFHGRWLVHSQEVVHEREVLGTLAMVYDLAGTYHRLWVNVAVSLMVGALATMVAFLLAMRLQRVVTRPVSELAATAAAVSRTNDFSIRAAKYSQDELGQLTDMFNEMLVQIQTRETGLQQAKDALAASNEELRNRNEEVQQFVYSVSHDLKAPVVTMIGFLAMLKEDLAAGREADAQDSLRHVAGAADRMSRLIQDLLELSRVGRVSAHPERIDTSAMVREIGDRLTAQLAECGAQLGVQPDMPQIRMDRIRLSQVFENLITNAIKYGCTGPQPRIDVGGLAVDGEVRFFVRDYGPGIAPQYHQRIFGLFQRLHNDKRGTGVGLAIVARVMQVNGGKAWVESQPGMGATFWVSLPGAISIPRAKGPISQPVVVASRELTVGAVKPIMAG